MGIVVKVKYNYKKEFFNSDKLQHMLLKKNIKYKLSKISLENKYCTHLQRNILKIKNTTYYINMKYAKCLETYTFKH